MTYSRFRPLLFRLDPERAHALSLRLLGIVGAVPPLRGAVTAAFRVRRADAVDAFGLRFPNPLGLAAGYDKDGTAWRGLACLGLGHVEVGTVTPRPQPGNPRPRVFRLPEQRSLINRLGFPSVGADAVRRRVARPRPADFRLGINLGKQKETPLERAAEDYARLIGIFAPLADYLVVNVSSPNTPELRRLQQRGYLEPLLRHLAGRRSDEAGALGRPVPLLVKLSPDLSDDDLDQALGAIDAAGVDGVIATNTTTERPGVPAALATEAGGLSGRALRRRSTEVVTAIHRRTDGRLPIVACGGVASVDDAKAKLDAGACLVQLYTGLVFEGPGVVGRILAGL